MANGAWRSGTNAPLSGRFAAGRVQLAALARDLHSLLEPGRKYADWFKDQVAACSLTEGEDFVREVSPASGRTNRSGRPRIDHVLAFPAAKEIAAAAGGRHGKRMRLYLLECERRYQESVSPAAVPGLSMSTGVADLGVTSAIAGRHKGIMDQGSLPLGIEEFLVLRGVGDKVAKHVASQSEKVLARGLLSGDLPGGCCVHPISGRLLFDREALAAWWLEAEPQVFRMAFGLLGG